MDKNSTHFCGLIVVEKRLEPSRVLVSEFLKRIEVLNAISDDRDRFLLFRPLENPNL